jgi:N-succinyldiaminopimelate aminotransferase
MSAREPLTARLAGFGTTIFAEMSALATETGAINLGQGFPDTDGPPAVLDAAVAAIRSGANQYPPGPGTPELRAAIAEHQARFYGLELDPGTEVLVTTGATEALAGALLGMLDAGDEVVTFEPMFDSYAAVVALAGARISPVLLAPAEGAASGGAQPAGTGSYRFDPDELRAAVTPRTKVLLLNTPHNPTGKVFDADEMAVLAEVAVEHDLIVVTDEVYEHLVFPGAVHIPMATLPGMADRTLTISSGGKTFSLTGWKVGWACGPAPLVAATRAAKQFLTYVSGSPFQPAIATGLRLGDAFFAGLGPAMAAKAARLGDGLRAAGFAVADPQATYFTTVDIRPVRPDGDGMALCRDLPGLCGVVAVPDEVFYARPENGRHLVRFACCKRDEVLDEACRRLATLAP